MYTASICPSIVLLVEISLMGYLHCREDAAKRRQEKEARKAREEQELQEGALKLLLEQVIPL